MSKVLSGRPPSRKGSRPARRPTKPGQGPRAPAPRAEQKPRPMPLPDGKCNPQCPYFRCLNNALVVMRKPVHGRMQKVAFCRWIGDECIGGSCQYASCAAKALLPDGSCLHAKEKQGRAAEKAMEEIEKELVEEEKQMSRIERLMKRRGYGVEEELL